MSDQKTASENFASYILGLLSEVEDYKTVYRTDAKGTYFVKITELLNKAIDERIVHALNQLAEQSEEQGKKAVNDLFMTQVGERPYD